MYKVEFTQQAEKDLLALEKSVAHRIAEKITFLSENIIRIIPAGLSGRFKGKHKLRVGDWRVVYGTNHSEETITIFAVDHRSRIYKQDI